MLSYKNTRNSSFGHICHNRLITLFQLRQLAKNIMLDFNFSKSNFIEECMDGFYSSSCTEVCGQCVNGSACNKDTGHCKNCSNNFLHPFCKGILPTFCLS